MPFDEHCADQGRAPTVGLGRQTAGLGGPAQAGQQRLGHATAQAGILAGQRDHVVDLVEQHVEQILRPQAGEPSPGALHRMAYLVVAVRWDEGAMTPSGQWRTLLEGCQGAVGDDAHAGHSRP